MSKRDTAFKSFADVLLDKSKNYPNKTAFEFLKEDNTFDIITYLDLHNRAQSIAYEIRKKCKQGDRVLLLYPPSADFVIAFWGCIYAGVIAVPSVPPVKKSSFLKRLQYIIECSSPMLCLTNTATSRLIKLNKLTRVISKIPLLKWLTKKINKLNPLDSNFTINIPLLLTNNVKVTNQSFTIECKLEDIMYLQFTSGSTDIPKGVIITHGNMLDNVQTIENEFQMTENYRGVSWLPPYHDMGLIGCILSPIFSGYPARLIPTIKFIKDPLIWLEHMSKFKATTSAAPNFAFDLCNRYYDENRMKDIDLSHWTRALCGAETIHYTTLKLFESIYSKHGFGLNSFLPAYGLAECTLYVTGVTNYGSESAISIDQEYFKQNKIMLVDKNHSHSLRLVSCGVNPIGQQVKIVDEEGNELPEDYIGKIVVNGKSVSKGYWNSPVETNNFFCFKVKNDSKKYLDTGDLGFLHHNHLYVTGRKKEIIIIHGKNYYPQWIEQTIQGLSPAIRKSCVAVFQLSEISKDRILIALEIYPNSINNEKEFKQLAINIYRKVFEEHDLQTESIVFLAKNSINKTTSGKVPRTLIAKQYYNNELKPLYTWHNLITMSNITLVEFDWPHYHKVDETNKITYLSKYVIDLVSQILKQENNLINPNVDITNYITDSLLQLDLISRLECILSITISPNMFLKYPTINQFAAAICKLISKANFKCSA